MVNKMTMTLQPPSKSTFVFLTGTSAVGKTTLFEYIKKEVVNAECVSISARTVREKLGNPKWEDLVNNTELARAHQRAVFNYFTASILARANVVAASASDLPHIYIFERSLIDVIGYSSSFGLSSFITTDSFADEMYHIPFITQLLKDQYKIECLYMHMLLDPSVPYDQIEARPTEDIRDACGDKVKGFLRNSPLRSFNHKRSSPEEAIAHLQEELLKI